MDVKGPSRICGQCHKEVAMDNFALHELHCRRFLSLCPDCDETVPREHLEQHRLDEHTQVNCNECNQQMECRLLMDHKLQECVARLLSCEFCELELLCRELQEHELVCGSRTERCSACHRYTMLRDLAGQHTHTCPAAAGAAGVPPPPLRQPRPPQTTAMTPDKSKVSCIRCMDFFPTEDMEEHKLGCAIAWRAISQEEEEEEEEGASALKVPRAPQEEEGDPDCVHPCSYCQLVLPQVTLRWHEPKCKTHLSMK